ncbi:MAG TPA: FG-GAP-like repeat-containing protein, partial [Candidatus Limnocylindrales bacterium]|nr:FG-GAP-like repeat-containing protein [Candidatus Limnocylindrales bacterium]
QNAQIAIDPTNGAVYVSWRAFKSGTQPDAIWVVKSTNGGATFGKPVRVAPIRPFDQGTSLTSFRSNGFQTMTVDPSGRIYVAWSERGHATLRPDPITGDARIVVSTSANSLSWTTPQPIRTGGLGHELMPALTFQAGRLRMIYYDLREDVSQIFGQYVDELPILTSNDPAARRHTLDVYVAQAAPGAVPVFTSVKLSDYASGVLPGTDEIQQLQFNPPNLPLFRQGTVPFMGDYLDLAPAPMFVQDGSGQWTYNTSASGSTIAHGFWTDNRDVRAPLDGNWENYTPVTSDAVQSHSLFDPSQIVPACLPGQTGMRNQNIYSARVTEGLFVGSPGNTKPLGSIQRAFVVVVQNESAAARSYRLTIANQPQGGSASFLQFTSATSPLTVLDVSVPPFSSVARSVFATSDDEHATIRVNVNEIATPGAPTSLPGGLSGTVVLNGDATNPSLQNPSLQNPSLQNPDIAVAEVYNPDITTAFVANPSLENPSLQNQILNPSLQNPSLQNPSLQNPSLQNDAIANPSIINPSLQNPSLQNPSLQNPSLQNPSLQNSDLVNGAIEDTTWQITNDGNTTASYSIKLVLNDTLPPGFRSQLLLHQTYTTPAADACTLALQPHTVLVANIPDPVFTPIADIANPSLQNPSLQNPTLSLAPGETAEVTLRIVDPNRFDGTTFEAQASVIPAVVAQSVNTEDAANGITQPSIALPLTITTPRLASANPGVAYQQTLQAAAANGATTWSVSNGSLPPGLTLDPATGTITGTPTTPGNYVFTVQSVDANGRTDTQSLSIQIDPTVPAGFSRVWNGVDTNWSNPANWSPNGVPTSADDVYVAAGLPVMPALTQNASVHTIVVEPGATLDTAGFTLVVGGNAFAGKTITGTGSVEIAGSDAHASGTFPNVSIGVNATVTLDGPLVVQGSLRLNAGARLVLNGQPATVAGSLLADACAARPVVSGSGATPLTAGGADVNCVDFSGAALTITGGTITRFDNTRFYGFTLNAGQSELTIVHPGTAAPMTFHGTSFLDSANPEFLVSATDSEPGGDPLAIVMADSIPADGSSKTQTGGGATVTWTSTTGAANLAIGQAVSGSRLAGSPLTYVVAVVNGGPAAASNVVVTDTLPSGATLVSALGPSGACAVSAGAATCTIGTLPAGAAAAIQIVVTPAAAGELTNTAAVQSSGTDPNATDNTQTTRTTIFAAATAADLSITKTDSADPVAPGAAFTYTVRVHNDGPAVAPDVVVRDEAPFGITFTAAIPDAGTCTLASGVVTCALGPLAVGQDATITITAVAGTNGVHANYASVTSTAPDPNPANNVAAQFTNVTEACTVPSFSSPLALASVGGEVFSLDSVDFDGDGAKDLVTSSQDGRSLIVFFNDGQGHFPTSTSFTGAEEVRGSAMADFNGDGLIDIAAVRSGNPRGDLLIARNNGARGFGTVTAVDIGADGSVPFTLLAADFNEDGHPDIAVELAGAEGPLVLLNDGAGNFSGGTVVPTGSPIQRLATGDFNEDGHVDLVVGHLGASQVISVLLGNGDGTFAAPVDFATNPRPRIRAVADLNEDGHLDLVVVDGITGSPNMNQLTTLFGDGHGGFGAPVVRRSDGNIHTVAVADVNGDGHVDLVSTDFVTSTFGVQFGDGAGNFSAPLGYGAPFFSGVVADDFNGDGRPDVALGDVNGIVRVFTNSCGQSPIDLAITAADAPDPVSEGDVVTYTATVRNLVDAAVSNVTVLATLPAGTFVGSSSSAGGTQSVSGAVVTWTVPSLASNATATFDYTLTTGAGGTLTFNVGVTADGADTSPGNNSATEFTTVTAGGGSLVVTNTNDSGPGSLRQAILDSNADVGDVDHVTFAIPGPGVHTITLESPLPPITAPVVIDGTTQPGFAGTPLIEVNGNGLSGAGLQVNADDSTIRGLAINRFAGNGIVLNGGGNTVEGTVIGSDPTGTFTRPNTLNGIAVSSANNRIGGTTPGAGNVIGGNALSGILVSGTGASGNTIQGNFIGSTVTEGVLDPLESADALEPDDIFVQQNGTATLSTVQNHTPRGSQSIALAPTDAGPHDIAVGGPINDTPIVGSVTIFFYDAGPGLSASLEIINSITGAVADVGTQEFDAGCYRAFVAPTPGDVRGPNASVDGCATNVATTSVARSIGWHKFSIRADGARYVLSIDDQTVFELPGTDGFDVLRVGVSGAGSGPTYFFDDLSIVAGDGAVLPNGRGIEIVDAPDTVVGGTS